jgi:cytoskeletal protein CcmA (bactofilin family)
MRKYVLWIGLLLLVLAVPLSPAWAAGEQPDDGRVIWGENFALAAGQVHRGNLAVIGGDADLEPGSRVLGDLFVSGGDAQIEGQVLGDLAIIGGNLDLGGEGQVDGDLFFAGGDVDVAGHVRGNLSTVRGDLTLRESAVVEGDIVTFASSYTREPGAQVLGRDRVPSLPAVPEVPSVPEVESKPFRPSTSGGLVDAVASVLVTLFTTALLVVVGTVVVAVLPRPVGRVRDELRANLALSFGVGLLAWLVAAGLEVIAALVMAVVALVAALLMTTVILIPVGLVLLILSPILLLPVPLALLTGLVLGWVAMAQQAGRWLLRSLKANRVSDALATFVGLVLLTTPLALLWLIRPCCLGLPLTVLFASMGLGAALLTRLGSRAYTASPPPTPAWPEEPTQPSTSPVEPVDPRETEPDDWDEFPTVEPEPDV